MTHRRIPSTARAPLAVVVASLMCAVLAASGGAQEKKKKEEAAARPLSVKLGALVLDPAGKPVGDLSREDFQILEDGAPQKISVFERREGPQVFGLVIDCTGSMRNHIDKVIAFAQTIATHTDAGSEGFVVRFVDSDDIKMMQDITTDKSALVSALDAVFIQGGQTAINDAVYLAAERVANYRQGQKSPRRYSLVLVTDGEDRASYYKDEQVFEKLREAGARVFVVGLPGTYEKWSPAKAKAYMNRLAFETGGEAYFAKRSDELPQVAERIFKAMGANYLLGYDSTNPKRDGSSRLVQLTVSGGAGGEQRKVLTADGYVAPKK